MSWPLASFGLLALALAGGFAWYERSKPSSRTVAVVASLAALATLGRIAFAPLPNVKPTTDIVLIAGYALGGAPGFAVGAVAAVASNIVFGQGPWTPWQMLAWGLVGLLGAAIARRRRRRPLPRLAMALICAAAGFGYGLVLNFSTWVTFSGQHTLAQFLVIEGEAFPFDLAHAVGNLIFFLAFGPALIRVLGRFKARMDVSWGLAGAASLALLACVGAAALGGGGRIASAQAAAPALAAPVGYLERAQNPDGGFGLSPGQPSSQLASAWVVIGLAAAGRAPGSVRRDGHDAVTWIRAHLGQISDAGDVERTLLALAAAHAPLGSLPARLRGDQRSDGSVFEQVNLTAFAILAWRAGADSGGLARAAAWLRRQQNADGGFSFAVLGDPSDIDDTAAALEALAATSAPARPLARARSYLERQENRDGGFPLQPGDSSNSQSTAWAVQALVAAGAPVPRALGYLRARTARSGAVRYAAGLDQTPVWVTAEALAALALRPLPIR
ncbi:MAG TPA: prenyltransferase/squalene oxidase repeat-containing protein [Solirubrobacteraceae bacterium]|nr:prenyltransferase/squalene oxidase repeat-containing protein [Solirubrobacteraceae bacterium]